MIEEPIELIEVVQYANRVPKYLWRVVMGVVTGGYSVVQVDNIDGPFRAQRRLDQEINFWDLLRDHPANAMQMRPTLGEAIAAFGLEDE